MKLVYKICPSCKGTKKRATEVKIKDENRFSLSFTDCYICNRKGIIPTELFIIEEGDIVPYCFNKLSKEEYKIMGI